ncbi:MAG: D-serine ammonia-lyase [Propionivibrio sp.]
MDSPQNHSSADTDLSHRLLARRPLLWRNPAHAPARKALAELAATHAIGFADIEAADALLRRWRPALVRLFPELAVSDGAIESPLIELPDARPLTGIDISGRKLIKADHALPVAGSIKVRGGIYEVLAHAEDLAAGYGLIAPGGDPLALVSVQARELFAGHTVAVGSTGNLGLSIGIVASALGFHAVVHMSHDAKQWKKERLKERGVEVVEHRGDYAAAVAAGRAAAAASARSYFVDDENSRNLFLGYAVAALRLKNQLAELGIGVDAAHPLVAYLPCGVGGAPGGITFGLKHVFGDAAHCYFAEPCASPAMLVRLASTTGPRSVYDLGLDNLTEADGLAVGEASELVYRLVRELVSGVYTVADDNLFTALARLRQTSGIAIEPSAAACFAGARWLGETLNREPNATHLFWTTGGSFVPAEEYERFYRRGCDLLRNA